MANLLATKPIKTILSEAHETGEHSLKRALGPSNLISLGIGAIIGDRKYRVLVFLMHTQAL